MEVTEERLKALEQQLKVNVDQIMRHLQDLVNSLNSLAATQGLEYSQDAKAWASTAKLAELRKNPR